MHYDYLIAGNVMLDKVVFLDASSPDSEHIGGPATFAYSGVRIWTDSVMQCSNVGADYSTLFKPWLQANRVETAGFKIACDRCNHSVMHFVDQGGEFAGPLQRQETEAEHWLKNDAWQDFGYMKTRPEDIDHFTRGASVKGVYVAQNADRIYWTKLRDIKKRDRFKLMWEIEGPWAHRHYLDDIADICRDTVDVFSINLSEAQALFACEGDAACIEGLRQLEVDLTLFRVGKRGLYVVTREQALYPPPAPGPIVDPTGCGNTSTGAALYAYTEGLDALMVGVMANVAASQNIRQYGVIPDFAAVRAESRQMAAALHETYRL